MNQTVPIPAPEQSVSREERLQLTHFNFENKVFAAPGAYFSLSADKSQAVFNVPLGDTVGAVALKALRATFGIAADSADDRLLTVVENSLKFVKVIRPGESIPRELLDGSASWTVEDRHRQIASSRLAVQLSTWISGREMVVTDSLQLEQIVEDPATKVRIQEAFVQLAQRLGLPPERKREVMEKIETFAHELAYIEALRERYNKVREIADRLAKYQVIYKTDRTWSNDLGRIVKLMAIPINDLDNIFLQLDAQSGEVLTLLKTFDSQVDYMRRMRNELHTKLFDWDELTKKWEDPIMDRGHSAEALMKETYRFLAQRFISTNVWKRPR